MNTSLINNQAYRDIDIWKELSLLFRELCCLPNGELIISTCSDFFLKVNPDTEEIYGYPILFPGWGHTVAGSLTATCTEPILYSLATRSVGTWLWSLGLSDAQEVVTEGVSCSAALSPKGELLAVGTGLPFAVKDNETPQAKIELFSTEDTSKPIKICSLPGSCVYRLIFHRSYNIIVAVTEELEHKRHWLCILDSHTLDIIRMTETPRCDRLFIDANPNRLVFVGVMELQVRPLDRVGMVEWYWETTQSWDGAAHDPKTGNLFLSNGKIIALGLGEIGRFPLLEKCMGMAVLPNGRVAGINRDGTLRIWESGYQGLIK